MPTAFDPLAAVTVHCTDADIDAQLAASVQEETYLAVHSCSPRIEQGKQQIWIPSLREYLTVYEPGMLYWDIEATVMQFNGLAHYHPGCSLTRRLLTSENATWRMPFQREAGGTLVYESPRLIQNGGQMPEIAFTLAEVMGGGLDAVNYPGSSTTSYFDIEAVAAVYPPTAALTALLQDVFHDAGHFDGDLMAQPYDGAPGSGGAAVLTDEVMDPWTVAAAAAQNEPGEWPEDAVTVYVHTVRWTRAGGQLCADVAVGGWVPANHVFRITQGDMTVNMIWPAAGVEAAPLFVNTALAHLMGDTATGILTAGSTLTVKAWSGDPDDGGSLLDTWTIQRDATRWTVSGAVATQAVDSSGSATAPGPGWTVDFVTAELSGADGYCIKVETAISVTSGNVIEVPAGTMTVDLD